MIDLAPSHKRGLALKSPVLNAAGTLGFADEYAGLIDFSLLGAFVTNPITARPRTPARGEHARQFDGGVLIHTGLPNPGIGEAVRHHARRWARLACPVVVHLAATMPEEVAAGIERLEALENVAGVEIGLRDDVEAAEAEALLAAAARLASLPVLARLPLLAAEKLAGAAARAGVQAVVVGGPPRGALPTPEGGWLAGRVYGPAVLPLALQAVRAVAGRLDLPVIGAGGIHRAEDAQAMLQAGAVAVQIDSAAWRDPRVFERTAASLGAGAPAQ
ncbi:MAG TPA: HisA/HisF-related TIM barrel protein [Ramlibacter sp.]